MACYKVLKGQSPQTGWVGPFATERECSEQCEQGACCHPNPNECASVSKCTCEKHYVQYGWKFVSGGSCDCWSCGNRVTNHVIKVGLNCRIDCSSSTGTCAQEFLSGVLESPEFSCKCLEGREPEAQLESMVLDNWGTVGGISFPLRPGCPAPVSNPVTQAVASEHIKVVVKDEKCNRCVLAVEYTARNGTGGGPYGLAGNVRWTLKQSNPLP